MKNELNSLAQHSAKIQATQPITNRRQKWQQQIVDNSFNRIQHQATLPCSLFSAFSGSVAVIIAATKAANSNIAIASKAITY